MIRYTTRNSEGMGKLLLYAYEPDAIRRLCDYEDAEENGTLIKLPCKVGDYIYSIGEGIYGYEVVTAYVSKIIVYVNEIRVHVQIDPDEEDEWDIDENIYFSRKAAEAALKERENE